MKIGLQTAVSAIIGLVAFAVLVFGPAGTFNYWQGWVFIVVFGLTTLIPSRYLAIHDPAALRRRMRAGPVAETRPLQKVASTLAFLFLVAMIVVSVLDHRFGWSAVPAGLSILGDVLLAAGLGISMLVVAQNGYAAANVIVESGQTVVTTGLYRLVRHPMYAGNVIMMLGIPLALGSYWGLVLMLPGLAILAMRILDEEKMLCAELDGYAEYMQRVHYRLAPGVW
ncbi:protein-S-isoprenylcysteine O-methyltransferase Ste14 [Mycobacterium frederiksbergense]|uniref:Protein-S-isoprenylcysteine O-methyltransferase Ste14 n=1 Tax=Mycolicibacterium frederiksbergense TaxID=117567 RepID=A0ABT6L3Q7_9MYCO|nr:isoprenylcysteine carboxylmethyltransferase family protein [Mycolicibacterium frederiksbergense]MDH6197565.1 protein-S-isoprenylcysteine O-methyltransferase Ste14 [Mycolicibacterium frederiksbergense]